MRIYINAARFIDDLWKNCSLPSNPGPPGRYETIWNPTIPSSTGSISPGLYVFSAMKLSRNFQHFFCLIHWSRMWVVSLWSFCKKSEFVIFREKTSLGFTMSWLKKCVIFPSYLCGEATFSRWTSPGLAAICWSKSSGRGSCPVGSGFGWGGFCWLVRCTRNHSKCLRFEFWNAFRNFPERIK